MQSIKDRFSKAPVDTAVLFFMVFLVLLYVAGVVWVWRRERRPPLIGELAERAGRAMRPAVE